MNARFAAILVLLVCWTFTAALCQDTTSAAAPSPAAATTIPATPSPPACDDVNKCVSEGDDCQYSWTANTIKCASTNGADCCAYGLGCSNGKCVTNNYGEACSDTVPCFTYVPLESLACSNSTCKYVSNVGDSCEDDDDNVCAAGLTCTNDVCTGSSINQTCTAIPCNGGLYCETLTQTCKELLTEGATCFGGDCASGFFCSINKTASVCAKTHTADKGDACTATAQCDDDYLCIAGTCTEPSDSYESCKTISDCKTGELCTCSSFSGDSFCLSASVNPCVEAQAEAADCAAENSCSGISNNENSCFYDNCYSKLKNLQSCGCGIADTVYSSCYYNDYCGGFPGWAIALIIIGAVAVVLAIVAVIFVAMKRKNTYDSI